MGLKEKVEQSVQRIENKAVVNYMNGVSYELSPIETLKFITSSSIFGEPQYYVDGAVKPKYVSQLRANQLNKIFAPFSIFEAKMTDGKNTAEIMEEAIDKALSYDFKATLDWAVTLRNDFYMRTNPQVIMVRASVHPSRVSFNMANPGYFKNIQKQVMRRLDDAIVQLDYYLYANGTKNNIPNVLKNTWAERLTSADRYELAKYKNKGSGIIDIVRISHARNELIDELMKNGDIKFEEKNQTWEVMRAVQKPWIEILHSCRMGHMALLRNLRGIFKEVDDVQITEKVLTDLKNGVEKGKQFPFRYYSAYNEIVKCPEIYNKKLILKALEECIDISCKNMPKIKGNTLALSDNSGSAWGDITSEYGTVKVAVIDNLSALMIAKCSTHGTVVKFGDTTIPYNVTGRTNLLNKLAEMNEKYSSDVGGGTEGGIWEWLDKATKEKIFYDNIFIFSDQQAGHGGLYGTPKQSKEYKDKYGIGGGWSTYIDVAKMIDDYRKEVNPKVNVFSIQTAGYNNSVIPEYGYRMNNLYGWTGKEALFADAIIKLWDEIDAKQKQ